MEVTVLSPGQAYFEATVATATLLLMGVIATFVLAGVTGDRLLSMGGGYFVSVLVGCYLAGRLWRLTRPSKRGSGAGSTPAETRRTR